MKTKIWKIIEHNRFTAALLAVAVVLWLCGIGCTPETVSPLTGKYVTAQELAIDEAQFMSNYALDIMKFDWAKEDLVIQAEQNEQFEQLLLTVASGGVTSWGSLLNLLITGGFIGSALDNVRKNGVIGGLKKLII